MKGITHTIQAHAKAGMQTSIALLAGTRGEIDTILATSSARRRLSDANVARMLANAREPAWAAISGVLVASMTSVLSVSKSHLETKLSVQLFPNVLDYLDKPMMGFTTHQWLLAAQLREQDRVAKAVKLARSQDKPLPQAFTEIDPFRPANSSIGALFTTTATSVANQIAMEAFDQANVRTYRLWTDGPVKDPDIYKMDFAVGRGLIGPMFIGDKSVPTI